MKTFIYTKENAVPKHLCESIIEFFESNKKEQSPGRIFLTDLKQSEDILSSDEEKVSTDICVSVHYENIFLNLMIDILNDCLNEYIEEYYFLRKVHTWTIDPHYNLQRYKPGEGYYAWHCENNGPGPISKDRVLAWMIYLNDVPDGGTEFNYELPNLEAKVGTVAIWPAHWTHFHRGIVSNTKTKYIATGWFVYTKEKENENSN
jgi:hypothetical protein